MSRHAFTLPRFTTRSTTAIESISTPRIGFLRHRLNEGMHMAIFERLCKRIARLLLVAFAIGLSASSYAGAIAFDTFLEFAFDGIAFATGCDPADPAGP